MDDQCKTLLRSNYFGVKDAQAFRSWCYRRGLNLIADKEFPGLVGITNAGEPEVGASDIIDELATFLDDGHVACLVEIYADPSCLLIGGRSYAVNKQKHQVDRDLFDIDQLGQDLGASFIQCRHCFIGPFYVRTTEEMLSPPINE